VKIMGLGLEGAARRVVPFVGALLACLALGCRDAPEDKIVGWPPPPGSLRGPAPADDPPSAGELAPMTEDGASPDAEGGGDEPATGGPPPGVGGGDAEGGGADPCAALVDRACELYGAWSDDCGEARARAPDGGHPLTRVACAEILERHATDEVLRGSPCRRYARAVCATLGQQTRSCERAQANVRRLVQPAQRRACAGDLVMWEARNLRR